MHATTALSVFRSVYIQLYPLLACRSVPQIISDAACNASWIWKQQQRSPTVALPFVPVSYVLVRRLATPSRLFAVWTAVFRPSLAISTVGQNGV